MLKLQLFEIISVIIWKDWRFSTLYVDIMLLQLGHDYLELLGWWRSKHFCDEVGLVGAFQQTTYPTIMVRVFSRQRNVSEWSAVWRILFKSVVPPGDKPEIVCLNPVQDWIFLVFTNETRQKAPLWLFRHCATFVLNFILTGRPVWALVSSAMEMLFSRAEGIVRILFRTMRVFHWIPFKSAMCIFQRHDFCWFSNDTTTTDFMSSFNLHGVTTARLQYKLD